MGKSWEKWKNIEQNGKELQTNPDLFYDTETFGN